MVMGVATSLIALFTLSAPVHYQEQPDQTGLPVLKEVMARFQAKDSAIVHVDRLDKTGDAIEYNGALTIWRKGSKFKWMFGGMWGDGLTYICDGKQMAIDNQEQSGIEIVPAPKTFAEVGQAGNGSNWQNFALAMFTKPDDIATFVDLKADVSVKEETNKKVLSFKHIAGSIITVELFKNGLIEVSYPRRGFQGGFGGGNNNAVIDRIKLAEVGPNIPDSMFTLPKGKSGA